MIDAKRTIAVLPEMVCTQTRCGYDPELGMLCRWIRSVKRRRKLIRQAVARSPVWLGLRVLGGLRKARRSVVAVPSGCRMDAPAPVALRGPGAADWRRVVSSTVARQCFAMVLLAVPFAARWPLLRGDRGETAVGVERTWNGQSRDVPSAVPAESLRAPGNRVSGTLWNTNSLNSLHLCQCTLAVHTGRHTRRLVFQRSICLYVPVARVKARNTWWNARPICRSTCNLMRSAFRVPCSWRRVVAFAP